MHKKQLPAVRLSICKLKYIYKYTVCMFVRVYIYTHTQYHKKTTYVIINS